MPSTNGYRTDDELAQLRPDTEGATLHGTPNDGFRPDGVTLGRLISRAMEVLDSKDKQRNVEIELRPKCWLDSARRRRLAERANFRKVG